MQKSHAEPAVISLKRREKLERARERESDQIICSIRIKSIKKKQLQARRHAIKGCTRRSEMYPFRRFRVEQRPTVGFYCRQFLAEVFTRTGRTYVTLPSLPSSLPPFPFPLPFPPSEALTFFNGGWSPGDGRRSQRKGNEKEEARWKSK